MKKDEEYSIKIMDCLQQLFDEDSDNYIEDLHEDDNATEFINALANLAPTIIYNQLCSEKVTILEFNHIANKLLFQNQIRYATEEQTSKSK